jgi:putative ABC transport system permease protein
MLYHQFFRFPNLAFRADRSAFPLALLVCAGAAVAGVFAAVRRAARIPPAEAMRPEPPANYRPAFVERSGIAHLLSHTFRIAVRNLERRPMQALFTIAGLALATGILVVPNAFRDSVAQILDTQWDSIQRQDLSVGLVEPASTQVRHLLRHLPGVITVEPARGVFARIGFGHQRRQLGISGIPADGLHNRVVDDHDHLIQIPPNGLVASTKLAEILGAKVGDELCVEILDGKRPTRNVRLVGLAGDFTGMTAYMDLPSLNRLMEEGDIISSANFRVDGAHRAEFLRALKGIPSIAWVAIKDSLRENFRTSTAASIGLIQKIYLVFAIVVAFGVVYNNARISLAERARELATLRVIGFSRREVGAVLVTELVVLAMIAVPFGLLLGTGFAKAIISAVNTETIRLPLVLTASNYAFAVMVVAVASALSALFVLRMLNQLDLVSALKAPE